uniref:Chitinase n=1 Tax=Psilocybe cubensis TaxID=181762 RepID=A0A8H8CJD7_PSICU
MGVSVVINKHTTTSKPYPHVVYVVEITTGTTKIVIHRRYSEFVALHAALKDGFSLPSKHAILTAIFPSGWLDDALIAERKVGLAKYLAALLWSPEFRDTPIIKGFLERDALKPDENIDVEDVLPSTLTRKDVSAFFSLRDQVQSLSLVEDDHEEEQVPVQEEPPKKKLVSAAYYPEWCAGTLPPESLDYSKFDIIFFGFATPNASSTLDWARDTLALLKRLIACAKASGFGTKIALSIGGWNGSQWFSHLCASANNRMTFVQTIQNVVNTYELDGIDLDWEFPNAKGAGNPYSAHDAANFLLLIQSLRSALGPAKIISAAVQHAPWAGADGTTLNDVSAYAESLTYINIMNYSVWGTSAPGPNAPLGHAIKNQRRVQTTAEAALLRWKTAGFPSGQILLGLPLFGHVFKSKKTALNGGTPPTPTDHILSFASHTFKGAHKAVYVKDLGKKPNSRGALSAWWGKPIAFKDIVASGALVKRFDGNYGHGDGFTMGWDDPSSTPYIFNVEKKTLITFDNTRSLAAKVKFAQENDLAVSSPCSLQHSWLQDDGTSLQDVIRAAMGK